MNTCPNCGKVEGGHSSILQGCVCQYSMQAPPQRTEQEPVAWLLTDKNINSLQVDSIQRLIDRLKHAHHADLCVRINGQDEWFEADWLKHMVRATPPQRTWVGLTDEEIAQGWKESWVTEQAFQSAVWWAEEKLKEKNT